LAEAAERAVQGRQVDVAVGQHRGGDDLAVEALFPERAAGREVESGEVMLVIATAVGVGDVDAVAVHGGHAHQRVAQPPLPDGTALDGEDSQLTALGVEDDVSVADDGRRRPVVGGLVLPGDGAGRGVQGVELVAAEAPAEEEEAVHHGGRGQGAAAGDGDLPPADGVVLRSKRRGTIHPGHFASEPGVDLHGWTSRKNGNQWPSGDRPMKRGLCPLDLEDAWGHE
jgi:hypothetical protein